MLSHDEIKKQVSMIASLYPVKRASYFGSYATGTQTRNSDLDLLVEFHTSGVSLIMLADMKMRLEDALSVSVDLIHYPLPEGAFLNIDKVVPVYEQ